METELTTIPIQCSCGYTWPYGGHAEVACCPKCGNKNKISTHRADDLRRPGKRGPGSMGVELKALSRQLDGAKDQIWGLREEKERLQSELTEVMFERGTLEKQVNRLIDEIQRLKNISTMGGIRGKTDIAYDDKLLKDAYEAMMKAPPGDVDQFINRQLEVAQNVARKQRDRLRERDKRIAELETRIRRLESTN